MCQVWFHAFSVKSDQGSQRTPKGSQCTSNSPSLHPPSLVIMQVKKKTLKWSKITVSSISPNSHNISFSPSSLHFRPDFSLLLILCLPPSFCQLNENQSNPRNNDLSIPLFNQPLFKCNQGVLEARALKRAGSNDLAVMQGSGYYQRWRTL